MKIIIFGAGAIGSLFGSYLSKKHEVVIIGRSPHVKSIKKNGLVITGKTKKNIKIHAETSIKALDFSPDLLIITVKSYDTEKAIQQAKKIIEDKTIILSLQNGLDNINILKKHINYKKILAGITTHGALFLKPGVIKHTGFGNTVIGDLNSKTNMARKIVKEFNKTGINTKTSKNITREIWIKAVINSSINPLTTFFQCKNGYLLKNPILEDIVKKICYESCMVAKTQGLKISYKEVLKKTINVIKKTSENYSSMLQSIKKGKKTEIKSINGKIVEIGNKKNIDVTINTSLLHMLNKNNKKPSFFLIYLL